MKLCEMAQEYRVNVALLELRIKQLQAAQKRTRQPEVRYRLKQRAKFLQTLINESRQTVLLRKALNCEIFNPRKKRHKSHIKRTLSRFQTHASSKIVRFGMLTFALSRIFLRPCVVNLSSDSGVLNRCPNQTNRRRIPL